MVQNVNPTFVKTPNTQITAFTTTAGAAGAFVTCYTAGTSGSKVIGVYITGTTTGATDCRLALTSSAGTGYFNTVSVTANSGISSTVPPTNGFLNAALPVDSDGNQFLLMPSTSYTLTAQITGLSSIWATGTSMMVTVLAGDF